MPGLTPSPDLLARGSVWLPQHMIVLAVAGSHLHGTNDERSDWNYRGVYIPPRRYVYGLESSNVFKLRASGETMYAYNLRGFVRLCLACNHNATELLWTPADKHAIHDPLWDKLHDVRRMFLNQKVCRTYGDYSYKQWAHVRMIYERTKVYNPRGAMFLLRLMRMGVEILRDGEVRVARPDADYLLAVKRGDVSMAEVGVEIESLYKTMCALRDASDLPRFVKRSATEDLVMSMISESLERKG